MDCPTCGAANAPGQKFCGECGTKLAAVCPNCGAAHQPGQKFCGECGTALHVVASPTEASRRSVPGEPTAAAAVAGSASGGAPPTSVAERRLVSVLFADLVGFTTFAEDRDAEEVRETLTRYFDIARDIIERYGGTVEKFIGDAVMAVWGTPTARENDAERAVRAGLELLVAIRDLGPAVQARAGVFTGEAAVTLGATDQGMVAGDIVNTAARIQSVAAPGTVLVGDATHRAASAAIVFEPVGEQTLKGKAAPVPVWRALRVVAERGGRGRSDSLEAPFIGRDDQLRLLKDLYHATAREGRTRLVSITGIGGIGKSRLAWEFEKYLDGLVGTVWWHHGRSPAYGQGITFWALGEMIRGRCGLTENDDEATTRAKVAEAVAAHVPDERERRWIGDALLALLGVEQPGVGPEELFGAWRTFVERLAASAPVVMVFEDLHWADPGTLDFIDHLLDWARHVPLAIITLARPELLERRPGWGGGRRNFVGLELEPLPEPAMREILAGLVPGLPGPTVKAIIERAEGIPLYAVETVRMLVADHRVELRDDVYVPVGDLSSLAIPDTLTALIAARLDALEPEERNLLLDAAVLGQSFTPAALAAVSGQPAADLEPTLRTLVRREILTVADDPLSAERGQYAFVQALIREVAYNTLARRDRKERHLAAARYFEALGSDELAGALAGQYLAAHESAADGPEAEALAVQARIALSAAADRAAALGAHAQATSFLEQALTVTTDPVDLAALHERAGESAAAAADDGRAIAHLSAARDLRLTGGDRAAVAQVTALLGRTQLSARQRAEGRALLEAAAAEYRDLAGQPELIAIESQLARAYYMTEEPRLAIEVADRVLESAEHADLIPALADTLVTKGSALGNLGRGYEGAGLIETARRLAEAHGLHSVALRAVNNLSTTTSEGVPRQGVEIIQGALALARRLGRTDWVHGFSGGLSDAAFRVGDWRLAESTVRAVLPDVTTPYQRSLLLNNLLDILAVTGRPLEAELGQLHEAQAALDESTRIQMGNEALGWIALSAGDADEAHTLWRRMAEASVGGAAPALRLAAHAALMARDLPGARRDLDDLDATGIHGQAIEASRVGTRAGIAGLEGRRSEALAAYREANAAWRNLDLPWDAALTALEMVTILGPDEPEVRAAAEPARLTLIRLGADPSLAQLDAALAGSPQERERAHPAPSGATAG